MCYYYGYGPVAFRLLWKAHCKYNPSRLSYRGQTVNLSFTVPRRCVQVSSSYLPLRIEVQEALLEHLPGPSRPCSTLDATCHMLDRQQVQTLFILVHGISRLLAATAHDSTIQYCMGGNSQPERAKQPIGAMTIAMTSPPRATPRALRPVGELACLLVQRCQAMSLLASFPSSTTFHKHKHHGTCTLVPRRRIGHRGRVRYSSPPHVIGVRPNVPFR